MKLRRKVVIDKVADRLPILYEQSPVSASASPAGK
jgi:hypothetical protein